jgi:hypothetical protein
MTRPLRPFLLPLLALALAAGPDAHGIMAPLSTRKLIDMSNCILEGRVQELTSRWTEDGTAVVTDVRLEPRLVLLGGPAPETFLIEGGRVDDVEQWVSDMPVLQTGERILVFLRPVSDEERKRDNGKDPKAGHTPAGGAQGVYHLRKGRALKGGFSVIGDHREVERSLDLKALRERIRLRLEETGRTGGAP